MCTNFTYHLPRASSVTAVTPPRFEYVGNPVLLRVGVESLGSERDRACLGRDADHVRAGGTEWRTEQARAVRPAAPGRRRPEPCPPTRGDHADVRHPVRRL